MIKGIPSAAVRIALAASVMVPFPRQASAQTLVEHSAEARFQLDVRVPDAALAAFLPAGFALNVSTQGAAKDANLRVVFIDRLTINGPDGKPVGKTGSNRLVYMIAPVKDPGGANAQLVIGGLTEDPADAPGPFGVYPKATTYSARNPGFYQISRDERVLDILRNVTTTPPDRVREFSFKGSGGSYAKLFDGTEKMLSWDNILWITRSVLLP